MSLYNIFNNCYYLQIFWRRAK